LFPTIVQHAEFEFLAATSALVNPFVAGASLVLGAALWVAVGFAEGCVLATSVQTFRLPFFLQISDCPSSLAFSPTFLQRLPSSASDAFEAGVAIVINESAIAKVKVFRMDELYLIFKSHRR
jgi:hypothetical protein